jgi:hypothetical protein
VIANVRGTISGGITGAAAGAAAGAQAGFTGGNAAQSGAQAGRDATIANYRDPVGDVLRGAGQGAVSGAQGAANAGAAAGTSAANAARDGATRAMEAQRTTAEAARDTLRRTAQGAASDAAAVGAISANVAGRAIADTANPKPVDATVSNWRNYDISGGVIATSAGAPDVTVPPAKLQTIPGEPVVTRDGERTITVWREQVVPASVNTRDGGTVLSGMVVRTEVVGPNGTQTTIAFVSIMFSNPVITELVPKVGGPLITVNGGQGLVIVTNTPPPPTQTAAAPAPASSPAPDDTVRVSASLGRGPEASAIAREATTARDFALKSLRNPMPVTVGVWEGAVQLEGAGGAQMVHKGESAALPEGGGKPIPMEGFQRTGLANPGLRPDRVNADLAQVFEEDGRNATGPGVYVQVRDGAVELRKDGNLVVLQKGDTGFTDTGSGPLRKFTTPPLFLGKDPFLARGVPRGTGGGGSGLMCGPAFGA